MKLSLSWIFDHIDADGRNFSIHDIVAQFNAKTAEIEHWYEIKFEPEKFTFARFVRKEQGKVVLFSPELNQEIIMSERPDLMQESYYLIAREDTHRWATLTDLFCEKDGLVPACHLTQAEAQGAWKKNIELHDYILEVDNKSVTHRPDLWGHRGYAREIAALFDLKLVQEDFFLAHKPIRHAEKMVKASQLIPVDVALENSACDRLAVFSIPKISYQASSLPMLLRLARIDARPLNLIVDITNYVMYDWGQPMHAFDAHKIEGALLVRDAYAQEKVTLLDGETITLRPQDTVIADRKKIVALAGIMGSKESSVTHQTTALIIEAAHMLATPVRLTATHFKKRTQASARFEKSLDPLQNTQALLRFIKILEQSGIAFQSQESLISLGSIPQTRMLSVSHQIIQEKMGITISSDYVMQCLTKLGFGVVIKNLQTLEYDITVPSFRVAKDIVQAEDIIEEIARLFGYQNIPLSLPARRMKPFAIDTLFKRRLIKNLCARLINAHEVYNYALFDEELLKKLSWQPDQAIYLQNPLSENRKRLVTSLVPNLLHTVAMNTTHTDLDMNFFEMNHCWQLVNNTVQEYNQLAVIMSSKKEINFYDGKAFIQKLSDALQLSIEWRKPTTHIPAWYSKYQTAELVVDERVIGYAGIGSFHMVHPFVDRSTFIVELDAHFLLSHTSKQPLYEPLPKYQSVAFDVSVLAPSTLTVTALEHILAFSDPRIKEVMLLDYFTKPEWQDQHSITIRCIVVDPVKTLSKEDIEEIMSAAQKAVQKAGAQVR